MPAPSGLIVEIQRDAFDANVPVSRMLRKMKAAASKLDLPPIEKWVEQELNGYTEEPPRYRKLIGKPKALNPYQGWIPIISEDEQFNEILEACYVRQSIASLEALLESNEVGHVQFPIPNQIIIELNRMNRTQFGNMAVHLSTSQIHGLLDAVRNLVLEWALKLEKAGIHGEGMTFNRDEKERAHSASTTFNIGQIGSMVGNLGVENKSAAITASNITVEQVSRLVEQLKPASAELLAAGADGTALLRALKVLEKQAAQSTLDQTVTTAALQDLRNALSGATGSLLASGAVQLITIMLGG
jgi:hypothetical protein